MGRVQANDVAGLRSMRRCDEPEGFRPMDSVATNDV